MDGVKENKKENREGRNGKREVPSARVGRIEKVFQNKTNQEVQRAQGKKDRATKSTLPINRSAGRRWQRTESKCAFCLHLSSSQRKILMVSQTFDLNLKDSILAEREADKRELVSSKIAGPEAQCHGALARAKRVGGEGRTELERTLMWAHLSDVDKKK